ncbi:TBC1 domain family member 14-like isoform X1 [Homalodisca vitripennis]|uniref:TBC1 domain family member 14-like isoform X1 n=1 Tax=Homalodisca vitripennis TaxID=197043 RepID=UPI001EEA1AB2|nr:TBC1 domain family member 14-like isoform X1 [Homalodisca vitripennis]
MKTVPSEQDYHDTEIQDDSIQEANITVLKDGLKVVGNPCQEHLPRSNSGSDIQNTCETENLIICNPDLAASFQTFKTEKHKLNPGHYLQKVFLSSVAQKFKSQSLPSCLEKKKFQKNLYSEAIDELNETSVPLVETSDNTSFGNRDSKESFSGDWFKTWPERGDKVLIRKGESYSDEKVQTNIICDEFSVSEILVKDNELKGSSFNTQSKRSVDGCNSETDDTFFDISKESHSCKENLFNGSLERRPIKESNKAKTTHSAKFEGSSKSIPLDRLLDNFPLAYSPITKQLLLIKPDNESIVNICGEEIYRPDSLNAITRRNAEEKLNLEESYNDKTGGGKGRTSNPRGLDCDLASSNFQRTSAEIGSFSSTVSSLSDNSPSTNEDSALGSLLDHGDTCSLVSVGGCSAFSEDSIEAKTKKKSLAGFFSRNVFNWKSGSRSEDSITRSVASWKLFGKSSSPQSSHTSLTVDHYADSDGGSLAPDSPCSVRSSSSGPRTFSHENRVASSSALIQLDRPANLPAKSEEEEARHRLEYQQMVEAARKKELKEAKQRKKQLQQQLRAEEQLAQATRVWTQEILPRWDQMHTGKKARELWWQGVPSCVRGRVWQLAIGNPLNLTHSLYDICVQRAQDRLRSGGGCDDEDSDNKEASMQQIQLDISRTFPHLCIFQRGGPYYDMLHCLLAAYVCYRPDVGYVQGMSFIAAVLILNMEAADAFVCFANLLNKPCHMAFFHLNQPLMEAYYSTYNELLRENLPQVYAHFSLTALSPDLYLLDWIYTVFTKAMSLDLASRVWDVFLRDGDEFLFRTALGVLHLCQDTLLQMDFVHGSQFLTRLPDDLSGDQLFKSISCIKMAVGKQSFQDILAANSIDCH